MSQLRARGRSGQCIPVRARHQEIKLYYVCSGSGVHMEVMLKARAPPFCLSFLFLCPSQDGWGVLLGRMRVISYCSTTKKKAGCEVFLLSVFKLPDELPALPCPSPFISAESVAGGAGARGIKSGFITKRAPDPGTPSLCCCQS